MNGNSFNQLVDDAAHAVEKLVPTRYLSRMASHERSLLGTSLRNVLTSTLFHVVEPDCEEGAVRKVELLLTLLMDKADEDRLSVMGLGQIAHEMDFGSMVGAYGVTSSRPVPAATLKAELLALGNDGSFFDYLFEERP